MSVGWDELVRRERVANTGLLDAYVNGREIVVSTTTIPRPNPGRADGRWPVVYSEQEGRLLFWHLAELDRRFASFEVEIL